MLLAKKDSDEQVLLAENQAWMESSSDSDQEINANMVFMAQIEMILSDSDESSSSTKETIAEVAYYTSESESESEFATLEYYDNSTNYGQTRCDLILTLNVKHNMQNLRKKDLMIRYSALCDNDKQHRNKIDEQEILFDKMSRQLVEMNNNVLRLQEKILEKDTKISELEAKGIGFENPRYFEKAKDLRPSLYDEKVIGLGSLKPYVPNVILEKIIIDLEDEVVSLLEKEKANLKTIKSLKSKECEKVENSKVIAHGMFKLSVSLSVSPMSMSKTFCDSKNVENLDTFSSVRRPKNSGVIWKKKGSSNISNVDLSDIIDSGCSKHMTGNRALLTNFVEKFLGTVCFGNNYFAKIAGYGDVVIGSITIK
nr:integrase, catalytic region, zinc finger, CCHC-type, peptidase aspartic, catalytic [Tanacetum cinerariifolium]